MGIDNLAEVGRRVVGVIQRPGPPSEERRFWKDVKATFSDRVPIPSDPGLPPGQREAINSKNNLHWRDFSGFVFQRFIKTGRFDVPPEAVVDSYLDDLRQKADQDCNADNVLTEGR